MKKLSGLILSFLVVSMVSYSQGGQTAITVPVNSSGSQTLQALLHRPNDYASTSNTYPLIVFLHGAGEAGNNLSKIYNNSGAGGPAYFIAQNQWPASFTSPSTGQATKFIVVSPQSPGWSTSATQVNYIIKHLVTNYRVDVNRIYITGLSAGGAGVVGYGVNKDLETGAALTPFYQAAAIVPMSAAISNPPQAYGTAIVANGVRPWGFGSAPSDIHGEFTMQLMNRVNTAQSGYARYTNYNGGHCCWNTYYNPNYRETINGRSMNIYEWMLQYSRNGSTPPPANQSPIANAGAPQTVTLPANSVTLTGTGSDPDGSISAYAWTKISGPSQFNIASPSQAQTVISNLVQGSYQFQLRVTDNAGATGTSNVTITVNPATAANQPPVANAGADRVITLPVNSVNLSGSGTDADGSIASYAWSKISGPSSFNFSNTAIANPSVSNLSAGTYTFRLTVRDNQGASASDDINVTVNAASSAAAIPGKIEAENYSNMSGIQNENTSDAGGGLNVGYIEDNDWMDYSVNVNTAGSYTVSFRVAALNAGARLQLIRSGSVLTTVDIPVTGGWQNWQTVNATVNLTSGTQTLRLSALKGGWNINWMNFTASSTPPPPPPTSGAKMIKVSLYGNSNAYGSSEWNNWSLPLSESANLNSSTFKYSDGSASTVKAVLSNSLNIADNGTNFGTGSTAMAPAAVLRHSNYYWKARTLTLNGLSSGKYYSIEFYAGRNSNPNNNTTFSVGGNGKTIATYNNTSNKASFANLQADASGKIVITISNSGQYNYLNGFTVTENSGVVAQSVETEVRSSAQTVFVTDGGNGNLSLNVANDLTGVMEIEIINNQGVTVKSFTIMKNGTAPAQVYLPASTLPAGSYTIKVIMDEFEESTSYLKN